MCSCAELGKMWTEEKCMQLIRKYKQNTILWDTKNILFYKQDFKSRIWDDIGKEFSTTGKECKHKISILMSSFRREKAKFVNGLKTGIPYKSPWFGFKELSFLLNRRSSTGQHIQMEHYERACSSITCKSKNYAASSANQKEQPPVSTDTVYLVVNDSENFIEKIETIDHEDESEDYNEGDSDTDIIQLTTPENHSTESCSSILNASNSTTYEHNFAQTEPTQETTKHITCTNCSDKIEEIVTFNNFIQAKMKKYSTKTLSAVQKAICDVIFNADQNYYENALSGDASLAASGTSDNRRAWSLKRKRSEFEMAETNQENVNSNNAQRKF